MKVLLCETIHLWKRGKKTIFVYLIRSLEKVKKKFCDPESLWFFVSGMYFSNDLQMIVQIVPIV